MRFCVLYVCVQRGAELVSFCVKEEIFTMRKNNDLGLQCVSLTEMLGLSQKLDLVCGHKRRLNRQQDEG